MAEMLVQSESLTSIADKIRVLSGTEDGMSLSTMENYVDDANADINTEADLIAQIAVALKGKAVEGGDSDPILQDKTVTPSSETQVISFDSAYDGLGSVTINGDSNLIPENVAEGVNIFGVTGTHVCESSGVTIQRSDSGSSFTTSTNGTATVTCGFKPDFVTIYLTTYDGDEEGLSFPFAEQNNPSNPYRAIGYFSNGIYDMTATRSTTGFSVTVVDGGWDFDTTPASKKTFNYIAIKYTQ